MDTSALPQIVLIGLFCASIFIYFLPAGIAGTRKNDDAIWIFLLNLILGWTVIVWVVLLVWAALGKTENEAIAAARAARGQQ